MALIVTLMINRSKIGHIIAERTSPYYPKDDDMCMYDWEVALGEQIEIGQLLEHRYGDGAWSLVSKIISISDITGGGK